jgi:hypothetical protein
MAPSERIKQRIDALADVAQSFYCNRAEITKWVTEIVDEAVREAILTTAKVMKE